MLIWEGGATISSSTGVAKEPRHMSELSAPIPTRERPSLEVIGLAILRYTASWSHPPLPCITHHQAKTLEHVTEKLECQELAEDVAIEPGSMHRIVASLGLESIPASMATRP